MHHSQRKEMERTGGSLSRNVVKQQREGNVIGSNQEINLREFKGKWNYKQLGSHDYCNFNPKSEEGSPAPGGFSWPPRCYSCSFCKREFRSAQALGGHMNVHRRDRARLRQYSPPKINLNLDPNPSFLSSNKMSFPHFGSPWGSLFDPARTRLSSSLCINAGAGGGSAVQIRPIAMGLPGKEAAGAEKVGVILGEKKREIVKKDMVGVGLEIGLIASYSDEELDLELRLGCTG